VALVLLAFFALANWSILAATTTLSFVAFKVEGPLGLTLLGFILVMAALFTVHALAVRTAMLMESRRFNQELQTQRNLAESAESSRLMELRAEIESEFANMRNLIADLSGRLDGVGPTVRTALDESGNSLAAQIGEMDDKLERVLARTGQRPGDAP
jgi:uncharacterized integral membrane protein